MGPSGVTGGGLRGVWGGGASLYFSYSVTNVGEFFTINRGKNPPKCSACVELLKYLQTYLALIITNYVKMAFNTAYREANSSKMSKTQRNVKSKIPYIQPYQNRKSHVQKTTL